MSTRDDRGPAPDLSADDSRHLVRRANVQDMTTHIGSCEPIALNVCDITLADGKVTIHLSEGASAVMMAAADKAGLPLVAYITEAILDRADQGTAPVMEIQRQALAELIKAAGLVRRIGDNLNQAAARLNATGELDFDFGTAANCCTQVVGRIDEAATQM